MYYKYTHNIVNDYRSFNQIISDTEISEKKFFEVLLKNKAIEKSTNFDEITLSAFIFSSETISKLTKELEFLRSKVSDEIKGIVDNITTILYKK